MHFWENKSRTLITNLVDKAASIIGGGRSLIKMERGTPGHHMKFTKINGYQAPTIYINAQLLEDIVF